MVEDGDEAAKEDANLPKRKREGRIGSQLKNLRVGYWCSGD